MNRKGIVLVAMSSLACAGVALAQPRVSVGEIKGKGGIMIRSAAVKALQSEHSVSLISKDVVAGSARRMGIELPKGRKEISAALGIGAWVEGTLEREKKALVTNLAVIDAASGKTLGVMSYDAPSMKLLTKTVRSELFSDLGELIKSGKVPGSKTKAAEAGEPVAANDAAGDSSESDEPVAAAPKRGQRPARAAAAAQPPTEEPSESAEPSAGSGEEVAEAQPAEEQSARAEHPESEPADESSGEAPSPFSLGIGLVGFTRDFVYSDAVTSLPQYNLGLGPSLAVNLDWYPGAHFSRGAAANIGLDVRGQVAFGLDSQLADKSSFPTSASSFGVGLRGRLPLGSTELGAVLGYAHKSFSIGTLEPAGQPAMPSATPRNHPYVPSASYAFMRVGVDARFALSEKFSLGGGLAYLPTFSTGFEDWFPRATAAGIEAEAKLGYTMSKSFELNATFGYQRFALSFNPTIDDAKAGKLIAGGAVDQYLSLALGMGWHFAP